MTARKGKPEQWGPEDAAHGVPGRDKPAGTEPETELAPAEQAGGPVTGAENLERQQKDPDLDDSTGAHP